jgi:hypothetical protein
MALRPEVIRLADVEAPLDEFGTRRLDIGHH